MNGVFIAIALASPAVHTFEGAEELSLFRDGCALMVEGFALYGVLELAKLLPRRAAFGARLAVAGWTAAILLGPSGNIPLASINLEFLMGIAVCVLYRRGKGHWLLLLVSAALLICWVLLGAREEQRLIVGLACACLTLQLSLMERRGRITVPAWLVFMGSASYALYLTHELVLPAAARLAGHSRILNFAVCVVACLSAAVAYYWWVERRLIARKSASRVTPPTTRAVSGQK